MSGTYQSDDESDPPDLSWVGLFLYDETIDYPQGFKFQYLPLFERLLL